MGVVNATGLEITAETRNEGTILRLRGRLTIDSSPAFRDHLLAVLGGQSAQALVIDMSGVSYLDVSGIATLVEGLKIARNRQNSLRLTGLQERVLHLFEFTGLLDLFERNGSRSASTALKVL
jgi:anti-sigma B factor antagonist